MNSFNALRGSPYAQQRGALEVEGVAGGTEATNNLGDNTEFRAASQQCDFVG